MGYFENFDNESVNKYKKNFKNEKKIIDVFFYVWIDSYLNFRKFHYRLIVHQRLNFLYNL
jgi:hypothetical protein